jgi:lipopolysaccharide export system protein LptC
VELRARLTVDTSGNVATVEAATGRFDTQGEQLDLTRDVRVISSTGYSLDLHSASIDFKTGTVVSPDPVRLEFDTGTIEADAMTIVESGAVITFEGNVRSVIAAPGLGSSSRGETAGTPLADAAPAAYPGSSPSVFARP